MRNRSLRVGAAAFALGLSLAGPQAVGVASADRGDADDSSASESHVRGSAQDDSAGVSVVSDETAGPRTPAGKTASETQYSDSEELSSTDEDPLGEDPLGEDPLGEDPLGEDPVGEDPVGEDPTGESDAGELPDISVAEPSSESGDESGPLLDDTVEETSADEPVTEESVTEESVTEESVTEDPVLFVDPVAGGVDPLPGSEWVNDPGAVPGRGGPQPLPWWRTNTATDGSEDEPSIAVPVALESAGPFDEPEMVWDDTGVETINSPPALSAGNMANAIDQAINALKTRISEVLDQVADWLSGLPENPITDFISGALLLLRRALQPAVQVRQETGDPGIAAIDPLPEPPGGLIGLTEDEAGEAAKDAGWVSRVVSREGEDFMITKDYSLWRVNLTVNGGVVTAAYVG